MAAMPGEHCIGGRWVRGGGERFESEDLVAGGKPAWRGRAAGERDIGQAVAAARAAFAGWRRERLEDRIESVERFADIVRRGDRALAQAIHRETGKPPWECRAEAAAMAAKAEVSVRALRTRAGAAEEADGAGGTRRLSHHPIGVFAVLGPFNFPGHLPNGHIIPALLAGNTVVFKPSEFTPWTGEAMMRCWAAAGLPPGVVNLVHGGADVGGALAAAEGIDGLLFTGSSRAGHAIHRAFAGRPEKMLALEMGGNNPLVVDAAADVDAAVYVIVQSAFLSAGQRCTCARRLILLRSRRNEALLARLAEVAGRLRVGVEDDCFMGPLISNAAADRVMAFARDLIDRGGRALAAPVRPDPARSFVRPGIIDVTGLAGLEDEECFGPVLKVMWADSLDEAVAEANNTRYGLSAGLISDSGEAWKRFAAEIRAGIVNFNRPTTGASAAAPFGGVGASGNYRPGAFYAADYSAYPVASAMSPRVALPETLAPGVAL